MKTAKKDIGLMVEQIKEGLYSRRELVELVITAWDLGFRKAMDQWDKAIQERNKA